MRSSYAYLIAFLLWIVPARLLSQSVRNACYDTVSRYFLHFTGDTSLDISSQSTQGIGNLILIGNMKPSTATQSTSLIARIGLGGHIEWTRALPPVPDSSFTIMDAVVCPDGTFIADAGIRYPGNTRKLTHCLMRWDGQGNLLRATSYALPNPSSGNLTVQKAKLILLPGNTVALILKTFNDNESSPNALTIAAFDSQDQLIWDRRSYGQDNDNGDFDAVWSNGSIYLSTLLDHGNASPGFTDMGIRIEKIDAATGTAMAGAAWLYAQKVAMPGFVTASLVLLMSNPDSIELVAQGTDALPLNNSFIRCTLDTNFNITAQATLRAFSPSTGIAYRLALNRYPVGAAATQLADGSLYLFLITNAYLYSPASKIMQLNTDAPITPLTSSLTVALDYQGWINLYSSASLNARQGVLHFRKSDDADPRDCFAQVGDPYNIAPASLIPITLAVTPASGHLQSLPSPQVNPVPLHIIEDSICQTNTQAFPAPRLDIQPDSALCHITGAMADTIHATAGYADYIWMSDSSNGSRGDSYPITSPGKYWVDVTDGHGCKNSDTVSIVKILPPPANFIEADTSVCPYVPIRLQPYDTRAWTSYLWNDGSSGGYLNIDQPGLYTLQVTDSNGCTATDSIRVTAATCMERIRFPNAFTPDNGTTNYLFRPIIRGGLKQYHLGIYNRWGRLVFESSDPAAGWNGRVNDHKQESGGYVWVCSYQFPGETQQTTSGNLLLIR